MIKGVQQWRTTDIVIRTGKEYKNPFEDVDVTADFAGPNGEKLHLLGFWDGEGTWIIRFAPTAAGIWSYTTEGSDGNEDFRTSGEVECVPYEGSLDIYKHGFLKVSDDRDYLAYADGTPFFWLGDTHWRFVTEERFDESNCPKYESQFRGCVDKRVEQRFTVYQCNFRDGLGIGAFGRNLDMMHRQEDGTFIPNLEIFHDNVDKKMKYLADVGLVTAVGYAWGFDMAVNGVERYKKFAKYTAARYGAYPVIWTLAGELPGYGRKEDLQVVADTWNEVAKVAEKYCGYQNLQSVHLANDRPFPVIYKDESWFDFAMSQAGHGDFDLGAGMYRDFKENYKGFPVLESECTYEGATSGEYITRVIDDKMMRRQAWLCIQLGGCGYTYGCNGVWELQWTAGNGGIGWGDMSWWDGLELPGANELTIMKDFYEEMNWAELKPLSLDDAEIDPMFGQPSDMRRIFFTGNADRTRVVGYIMQTSMSDFHINGMSDGTYKIWLMNPEDGKRTVVDENVKPVDGTVSYKLRELIPHRSDMVVVIEKN